MNDEFFPTLFLVALGIFFCVLMSDCESDNKKKWRARREACEQTTVCGPGKHGVWAYTRDRQAETCFCDIDLPAAP